MKRRCLRVGTIIFRDPLLLCCGLYALLWLDFGGYLRLGLAAAALHELGHIAVYILIARRPPVIVVTATGFCMKTRGDAFTPAQTFALALAGPAANIALALIWAEKMSLSATVRGSAFLTANILTAAFNLLPVPPLDGAQLAACAVELLRAKKRDCISGGNRVK